MGKTVEARLRAVADSRFQYLETHDVFEARVKERRRLVPAG
jgi:hypothetical protein